MKTNLSNYLVILILLFFSKTIFAENIDSLQNELLTCKDSNSKAILYNKIADVYLGFDVKTARIYADSAFSISLESNNPLNTSNSLINIGNTYYYKGDLDSTLFYYEKSYNEILKSNDSNEIASSLNRLGLIYESKSDYKKASEYFLKAVNIFEKNKNKKGIADVYNNLGIINDRLANYIKSLEYYRISLNIYKEINNSTGLANVLNNLASVYSEQDRLDSALIYLKKSVKILLKIKRLPQIATAYNNIGSIFIDKNKYDSAFYYMNMSLNINQKLESKTGIAESFYEMAQIFIAKHEHDKALSHLFKSLEMWNLSGNLLNKFKTLKKISIVYKYKKKYEKSLEYYELYTELKDSVYKEKTKYEISNLQIKYETEKKDKEIKLLLKDAKLKKNFNILLTIVAIALLIISILLFYAFRTKSVVLQKNKALLDQQEELSMLETETQNAQKKLLEEEIKKQQEINFLQEEKHKVELNHKNRELTTAAMHLLNKNKMLGDIQKSLDDLREKSGNEFKLKSKHLINEINQNMNLDSDWEDFKLHFEKVNPGFFSRFKEKYPDITTNDLRLCAYIKINLSSKEIAQMLNITLSGVNKRLYRLRKKIGIEKGASINEFLINL